MKCEYCDTSREGDDWYVCNECVADQFTKAKIETTWKNTATMLYECLYAIHIGEPLPSFIVARALEMYDEAGLND